MKVCISVLMVLMCAGVCNCENTMLFRMYVMRPPPGL